MMSEEEFNGWQETVHLPRGPRNAERLLRSIRSAEAGEARERDPAPAKPPAEP
jgi:antitoxin YefM